MRISFCKINITITYPLVALLCMSIIASKKYIGLIALISAVFHELGHIAVMKYFSDDVIDVRAGLFEFAIKDPLRNISGYKRDVFVICAGPLVNIVLWAICFVIYKLTLCSIVYDAAMVNLSLGLFNLLPIESTDGGQLLKIFLDKSF